MTSLIERWIESTRMQRSTAEVLENKLLESSKLTLNEYYVLYFLNKAKNKKMRLNDLQIEIGLSQSAMSRMISRMEDKNCGVIERHICSDDKRGVYISLTQSGINMLEKGQIIVDDVLQDLLNKNKTSNELTKKILFIHARACIYLNRRTKGIKGTGKHRYLRQ